MGGYIKVVAWVCEYVCATTEGRRFFLFCILYSIAAPYSMLTTNVFEVKLSEPLVN